MKYTVSRYGLDKQFISSGELTIEGKNHATELTYIDKYIHVSASELYHPIAALERLRKILETDYRSILAIYGCRIDTAYRPTGSFMTYIIEHGKQATNSVSLFEPTTAIDKLCTVEEHKDEYDKWITSDKRITVANSSLV